MANVSPNSVGQGLFAPAGAPAQGSAPAEPKVKAQFYANIGIPVSYADPDSGEIVHEVLSLPIGLALDTMREAEVPTRAPTTNQSKLYRDRLASKNALLAEAMRRFLSMAPGEAAIQPDFVVQFQRVGVAAAPVDAVNDTSNVFALAFAALKSPAAV